MLRWLQSRKGFLGFAMVDVVSTIFIAITIIIFLAIFIIADFANQDKVQTLTAAQTTFENSILINYLNTNVDGIKMAEFIELNKDDNLIIKEKSNQIMSKICSKDQKPSCSWDITIYFEDKKICCIGTIISTSGYFIPKEDTILVAGFYQNYNIGLELRYGTLTGEV